MPRNPDEQPKTQSDSEPSPKDFSRSVRESSRHIWLAGLGAYSRAQAEGKKVFDTLVKQGETLESHTRSAAANTAAAARDAATESAARVQAVAGDTWDKLEKVFDDRIAKALARLGVQRQSDIDRLSRRVDELQATVAARAATRAREQKPGRKSAPVKRATKSPVAARARPAGKAVTKTTASTRSPSSKGARVASKEPK